MQNSQQNNKRIAKNTLLLYFRMLLLMVVSLYTSRVTLAALGVEDYGIYNVVGGVVAMFTILSGSLSSAVSRFITFELGRGDMERLKVVFSSSVNIQIGLAIAIFLLAEIGGVWFLNCKMNISPERMVAANWVLQCSILTFIVNLISIPYNAAIIAHEKMSAFAYISILDAIMKLLIVYLLYVFLFDRLIIYAILLCTEAVLLRLIYGIYCKRNFEECTYHFVYDKDVVKSMATFSGWNFIGVSSAVLRDQGVNVVINLFCGAAVNAARGISTQVNSAVHGFVTNFMTAMNPQITKSYASGDRDYMFFLIFQGSRLSFYMLLFLSLPVILEAETFLRIWLNEVPEHTTLFVQLILLFGMEEAISTPLITVMLATGDIKKYQIIVGGLQMLNFPISYLLLEIGLFPESTLIVSILIGQCCMAARLYLLKKMIELPVAAFLKQVYLNIVEVCIVASVIPVILHCAMSDGWLRFFVVIAISLTCSSISIFFVGCSRKEREFAKTKLKQITRKVLIR